MKKPKTAKASAKGEKKVDAPAKAKLTKLGRLQAMLQRPEGATIAQLVKSLDWQAHSVRGAMSGSLKKKQGLKIVGTKADGQERVYKISG